MKKLILVLAIAALTACSKENENPDFGCVYGIVISTGQTKYIACMHREIYNAGYNQAAADQIADRLGIARQDVTGLKNYSNLSFKANTKCDCQ